MIDHQLPNTPDALALWLKALGDAQRLTVLQLLGYTSLAVLELAEILGVKQTALSHHLKVLAQAELVEQRREGNTIFYRRRLPAGQWQALHRNALKALDDQELAADVAERLAEVEERRSEKSRAYFAEAVDAVSDQELIVKFEEYGAVAADMLQRAQPQVAPEALEIGPGDGQFLAMIAPQFEKLVALDNSAPLIARAKANLQAQAVSKVEWVQGDWPKAAPPRQFDAVILNMVLRHLPSPADCFVSAARRLRAGGVMLITELCRHDQQWASEQCGDLWLGFEEQELESWAERAGLALLESQFIALRNGFQVQVRTFVHAEPE